MIANLVVLLFLLLQIIKQSDVNDQDVATTWLVTYI